MTTNFPNDPTGPDNPVGGWIPPTGPTGTTGPVDPYPTGPVDPYPTGPDIHPPGPPLGPGPSLWDKLMAWLRGLFGR